MGDGAYKLVCHPEHSEGSRVVGKINYVGASHQDPSLRSG